LNSVNLEVLVKLENEGLKVYPSPKNTKTDSEKAFKKHFIQNIIFPPQITAASTI
jgi:hypothetical protein